MTESSVTTDLTSVQLYTTVSGLEMDNTTQVTSNETDVGRSRVPNLIVTYTAIELLLFGLCGNVAIMLVLRRDGLRRSASSIFLFCMALADSATLIIGLTNEWLESSGTVVFTELSPWTCRWKRYLHFSAGDTATWLLVVFSIARCWKIIHTVSRRRCNSSTCAMRLCALVFTCALLKNLHIFWTRGPMYNDHGDLLGNCKDVYVDFSHNVLPWLRQVSVSIVPFCVIAVCNSLIIKKIIESKRRIVATTGSVYSRTMVMCVSASIAFLLLECPLFIVLTGRKYWHKSDTLNIVFKVTILLGYVNHSINVLLYCGSNSIFRLNLWALVTRRSTWRERQRQLQIHGHRRQPRNYGMRADSTVSSISVVEDSSSEQRDA